MEGCLLMNGSKGQGATEYLVILGVVLLIGLIVISLLGFFPGTAKDISITESQIYWQGSARPLQITDSGYTLFGGFCTVEGSSAITLAIRNTEVDAVTLTAVSVNGVPKTFCLTGTANDETVPVYFGPTETKMIDVAPLDSCSAGQTLNVELSFSYSSYHGLAQTQKGTKKFVVPC